MSIKPVTYYEIDCDDCGLALSDVAEFSAMTDPADTISMWVDADGFHMGGLALCHDHAPRCIHGYSQSPDEDDEPMCDVCADEIERGRS